MCQALVWGDFPGCQLFFLASSELLSMAAFLTRSASDKYREKIICYGDTQSTYCRVESHLAAEKHKYSFFLNLGKIYITCKFCPF